ncbi:hybrid sensor histidine kinase/response regulator [Thermosulfuriphilus sp.]
MGNNSCSGICSLFRSLPDIIIGINHKREILFVNEKAEALYGPPEGRLCYQYLFSQKEVCRFCPLEEVLHQGPVRLEINVSQGHFDVWLYPADYEGQKIVVCVLRDISRLKEVESQLRRAQKMEAVARLAGGIAHNFNNLLMAAMGQIEMALLELPSGKTSERLQKVLKRLGQGVELTNKLLTLGQGQILEPRPGNINQEINRTLDLVRHLLGEDIILKTDLSPDLPPVRYDPTALEQIILNLVINARDAMPQGGSLSIKTFSEGKRVIMEISDTGLGIPPEIQERIFEPFFTTKKEDKGTGLGLSMVYFLIKALKGDIEVRSLPQEGTTFRMTFPASEEKEGPRRTLRVLVAEDDDSIRELLEEALSLRGFKVKVASDGHEALEFLKRPGVSYDVLIFDLVMPRISGLRLIEEALVRFPKATIVAMSGYNHGADLPSLGERVHFLQKPFRLEKILSLLKPLKSQEGSKEESQRLCHQ